MRLLRQNQLALFRPAESIDLPIVLNPDLVTTARQGVEADNLRQLILQIL